MRLSETFMIGKHAFVTFEAHLIVTKQVRAIKIEKYQHLGGGFVCSSFGRASIGFLFGLISEKTTELIYTYRKLNAILQA